MELRVYPATARNGRSVVLLDDDEEIFELATRFLTGLARSPRGMSPHTVHLYGKNLKYFCAYLRKSGAYAGLSLDQIVAAVPSGVVDQYLAGLLGGSRDQAPLKRTTIRNRDAVLQTFFKWLTTEEAGRVRPDDIYESGLRSANPPRDTPRYVTPAQVIRLLQHLNNESERCLVHAMYDLGIRVSEAPRISRADIEELEKWPAEWAYLPVIIKRSKARGGNNTRLDLSLLSRAVYDRIRRYHSSTAYRWSKNNPDRIAFLNTEGNPIERSAIQKSIERAAKRAGFKSGQISPHRLRHGTALSIMNSEFGTDALEKLVAVKTQLGHASIKTTEIYVALSKFVLANFNAGAPVRVRFEEAQEIFERTFIPSRASRRA